MIGGCRSASEASKRVQMACGFRFAHNKLLPLAVREVLDFNIIVNTFLQLVCRGVFARRRIV